MTKTVTITSEKHEFEVKLSSKNTNYVYDPSLTDKQEVRINPVYNNKKYSVESISSRKGDDLVAIMYFIKDGIKKTVTSTIKNYYTDTAHADKVYISYSPIAPDTTAISNSSFYDEILEGKTYENSESFNSVIGNNKSNTYILSNSGGDRVYDAKGNETYRISHSSDKTSIRDITGKDKYYLSNGGKTDIYDLGGKDEYNIENAFFYISDSKENDKYTVTGLTADSSIVEWRGSDKYYLSNIDKKISIMDFVGSDKFNIDGVNGLSLRDQHRSDIYNIKNVVHKVGDGITDTKGNEKYNLENVKGGDLDFKIFDWSGKDKYTIKNSTNTGENKRLVIEDGRDDWSGQYYVSGGDKYTLINADYTDITDHGGKNKFTVKSDFVRISADGAGNDKYNNDKYTVSGTAAVYNKKKVLIKEAQYRTGVLIQDGYGNEGTKKSSKDVYNYSYYEHYTDDNEDYKDKADVVDFGGSDTYNLKNTKGMEIRDYQFDGTKYKNTFNIKYSSDFDIRVSGDNIADIGSYIATNDKYNIVSSSGSISDYSSTSNDTYKINKLNNSVSIQDFGGSKDSLTITGAKKNNLVFMTDGGATTNLYIYDKKDKGFVSIANYFGDSADNNKDTDERYIYEDDCALKIETIKAGKTNVNSRIMSASDMNNVKADVASWLSSNYAGNMVDALEAAKTGADIGQLVAYFTK